MKPSILLAGLALALPWSTLHADTFLLKDGTSLDGKILREDAESYTLEVQVTKSIRDERVVAKKDVRRIDRAQPDRDAFEEIKTLVPTPDLLDAAEYEKRIQQVESTIAKYPDNFRVSSAQTVLETLQTELAAIRAGGIKINGRILPPAEYRANAYELDSKVAAANLLKDIAAGQTLKALRDFPAFEAEFAATSAFTEILPEITRVMRERRTIAAGELATLDTRTQRRKASLERLSPAERPAIERAYLEEAEALEKRFQAEKTAQVKWPIIDAFHKASLEETVRHADSEMKRLETAATNRPAIEGGKAYRDAWAAIQNASGEDAPRKIQDAISALRNARLPERYVKPIEELAARATRGN